MTVALFLFGLIALAASIAILVAGVKWINAQVSADDFINWDDCL